MGLDAVVYCDCVEEGRLKVPHPFPTRLFIDEDGRPNINVDDLTDVYSAEEQAHDEWVHNSPCEHSQCAVASHYLGNIALVGALREAVANLSKGEDDFPILRQKVIYSGSHAGDRLNLEQVAALTDELEDLERRDWSRLKRRNTEYLRHFLMQMKDLVIASLSFEKPISF